MDKIGDYNWGRWATTNIPNISRHYRFQCDCLAPEDAMDVAVTETGGEIMIIITMQFRGCGLASRLRYAYQILRGVWGWREFIVRPEDYSPLSHIFEALTWGRGSNERD